MILIILLKIYLYAALIMATYSLLRAYKSLKNLGSFWKIALFFTLQPMIAIRELYDVAKSKWKQ